jgi:hypothetical protein
VVRAARAVRAWERAVDARGIRNASHIGVIHTYTKRGGIGNRAMQHLVAAVIAMATQRMVFPFDFGHHEYEYPPTFRSALGCPLGHTHVEIPGNGQFLHANFTPPNYAANHLHLRMVFLSSMIYLHPQLSRFCRDTFGLHANYFMLNYIMRIPERYLKNCEAFLERVPRTVRLFGMHLRYHYADNFYSRGIPQTLAAVLPFCTDQLAFRPTVFFLATDNQDLLNAVKQQITVITAPVRRGADGPDDSALTDIVMLMMCEEWLLSWRSTYSGLISLKMGRRCWMIEKYSTHVFLASHSQILHFQTPLYIKMWEWKSFDLNSIAEIRPHGQVENMRYYYRWFIL